MQKSTSVCSSMGEKILARIKREWFHIASIHNQGGFDMPAEEAFMGGTVSKRTVACTIETALTVKELLGRASARAPSIPDYIVMVVGAP